MKHYSYLQYRYIHQLFSEFKFFYTCHLIVLTFAYLLYKLFLIYSLSLIIKSEAYLTTVMLQKSSLLSNLNFKSNLNL